MEINNISHISLTKADIAKLIQLVSAFANASDNSQVIINAFERCNVNRSAFVDIYNPSITVIEDNMVKALKQFAGMACTNQDIMKVFTDNNLKVINFLGN